MFSLSATHVYSQKDISKKGRKLETGPFKYNDDIDTYYEDTSEYYYEDYGRHYDDSDHNYNDYNGMRIIYLQIII